MLAQELDAVGEESDVLAHATEVPQVEPSTSGSPLVVYGVLRCDAILESARTNYPYAPSYALDPSSYDEEGSFRMGAQDSRLGVIWRSASDPNLTAQAEWDVRSYDASSYQVEYPWIRMNRGFFQYRGDNWAVRAGHDWDVFGGRRPDTLNYEYLRMAGNVGYRRPIIRYDLATGEGRKISVALAGPIGDAGWLPTWYDTGADAALPDIQGSFTQRGGGLDLCISGVVGKRKDNWSPLSPEDFAVWGLCADVRIDLQQMGVMDAPFFIEAEAWFGSNLSSYMGGVGQGVVYDGGWTEAGEVPAWGFWAGVQVPLTDSQTIGGGLGLDDPIEDEVSFATLSIEANSVIWAAWHWKVSEQFEVGAEFNQFITKHAADDGLATSIRFVGAAKF